MKKKLLILGIIMTLALTACGKSEKKEDVKETKTTEQTTEEPEKETKAEEKKKLRLLNKNPVIFL